MNGVWPLAVIGQQSRRPPLAAVARAYSSPLTGGAAKGVYAVQQHATPCTCGGTSALYYI